MTTKLLGVFALIIAPAIVAANDDPMVAAVRKRQEAVRTLVVVYKLTNFHMSRSAVTGVAPAAPGFVPGEKLTNEWTCRLIFDGAKSREEMEFTEPRGAYEPNRLRSITVRDGTSRKHLIYQGPEAANRMHGSIGSDDGSRNTSLPPPLAMTFRGLDHAMSYFRLDRLKPTGAEATIDGSACREYSLPAGNPGTGFWFEPEKDFVLRRLLTREEGRVIRQTDIRYREDKDAGWVPARWTHVEYESFGAVRTRSEVEVLSVAFNQSQAADQFELAFPPGARVVDNRDNKEYDIGPDGTFQKVKKEPPPSSGPPWYMRTRWMSYAVFIGLIVLIATIIGIRSLRIKSEARPAAPR